MKSLLVGTAELLVIGGHTQDKVVTSGKEGTGGENLPLKEQLGQGSQIFAFRCSDFQLCSKHTGCCSSSGKIAGPWFLR